MANKHFVVVVGAGASRELGSQPVPMMADWAELVYADLEASGFDPRSIGLERE